MTEINGLTVIIPFRNEAPHLHSIIAALEGQENSKEGVEVIWIDDESDDDGLAIVTIAVARNRNWKCLKREGVPGKKSAIQTGILAARHDYILTTDADCTMDTTWIERTKSILQGNPDMDMFIMPVIVKLEHNIWSQFQHAESLQLLSLSSITSALGFPVLCSGANLVFRKSFYERAYECRNDFHIASGDDMFLLQQAEKVRFIASSKVLVTTQPTKDWTSLIHQRMRWFGKVCNLSRPRFFIVGTLVGIWQFGLCLLLLITWFFQLSWMPFMILTGVKLIIDLALQYWMARRLKQSFYPLYGLFFSLAYPLFQLVVLFMSIFIEPVWKGRAISR